MRIGGVGKSANKLYKGFQKDCLECEKLLVAHGTTSMITSFRRKEMKVCVLGSSLRRIIGVNAITRVKRGACKQLPVSHQ